MHIVISRFSFLVYVSCMVTFFPLVSSCKKRVCSLFSRCCHWTSKQHTYLRCAYSTSDTQEKKQSVSTYKQTNEPNTKQRTKNKGQTPPPPLVLLVCFAFLNGQGLHCQMSIMNNRKDVLLMHDYLDVEEWYLFSFISTAH